MSSFAQPAFIPTYNDQDYTGFLYIAKAPTSTFVPLVESDSDYPHQTHATTTGENAASQKGTVPTSAPLSSLQGKYEVFETVADQSIEPLAPVAASQVTSEPSEANSTPATTASTVAKTAPMPTGENATPKDLSTDAPHEHHHHHHEGEHLPMGWWPPTQEEDLEEDYALSESDSEGE